jgi:hypothetical protein
MVHTMAADPGGYSNHQHGHSWAICGTRDQRMAEMGNYRRFSARFSSVSQTSKTLFRSVYETSSNFVFAFGKHNMKFFQFCKYYPINKKNCLRIAHTTMDWGVASAAVVVLLLLGAVRFVRRSSSGKAKSLQIQKENADYLQEWKDEVPQRAQKQMQEKEGKAEVVPYHWGRYKQALPLPDVAAPSWRLKQWHYHSINNGTPTYTNKQI